MMFDRYFLLAAALALLGACDDGGRAPASQTPPVQPGEAAAPPAVVSDTASASTPDATSAAHPVDAHALYAARCQFCHGKSGEGMAGNPSLATLSRADIRDRLENYRAGKTVGRKSGIMAPVAGKLGDEEIAALAIYLGS
jgi:cytochrome c553